MAISRRWCLPRLLSCAGAIALLAADPAFAQSVAPAGEAAPPVDTTIDSLWTRDKLFGDLGGVRSQFAAKGIELNAVETSEVLGNVTGGIKQNATYEGALLATLTIDTSKLIGWQGGKFDVSGWDIRGRGLSANNLDNYNVVSSIEAPVGVRLFELWYEQSLLNDKVSIRIGQLAVDQEFLISQYATPFVNSAFGWPTLPGTVLPEGGPAYPYATPGVRLKVQASDQLTLLAALFNGDPNDNGTGTSFTVNDGAFAIAEAQYAINGGEHAAGLPGTYRAGVWYNSDEFADQLWSTNGVPLTNPASNNIAVNHKGDWSLYAVADQMLYKVPGTKDQGLGVFARIMGAPDDRNIIDFYLDAGLNYKGLIPNRGDDIAGFAVMYAKISGIASELDVDTAYYLSRPYPVQTAETMIEATYVAQVTPWWTLQPDVQYLFNSQGSIPDPYHPTRPIPDAAIFGLRTTITF